MVNIFQRMRNEHGSKIGGLIWLPLLVSLGITTTARSQVADSAQRAFYEEPVTSAGEDAAEIADPFTAMDEIRSATPQRPHAPPFQFRQPQRGSRKIIRTGATAESTEPGKLSAPGKDRPRRLSSPDSKRTAPRPLGLPTSLPNVLGSLAAVLGLFLLLAWMLRRGKPKGTAALPGEVFETLGRGVLSGRQQVQLVRCGNKLLLVCLTPNGAQTLTEISDPAEVARVAGICYQGNPGSATAAFRAMFQQMNQRRPRTLRSEEIDLSNLEALAIHGPGREEGDA